ncbi:PKD domain-containing protein [uncultured Polaribacter sp.]|uniref:PKD domain-containing protein n=1 Tax=uncultured Polaribacter sp. TaxID=174711 RepID=UPI0026271214|nr:PKD domain-containing protein [uncultured Polaribacter sp.]
MKKLFKNILKINLILLCVITLCSLVSCDEDLFAFDLPEAGSIEDTTPPTAAFTYLADPAGFYVINFTNTSSEAISFLWEFPDGSTTTDVNTQYTFPEAEDVYQVTLTATDGNGVSNTGTFDVNVVPGPVTPVILNPDFDAGTDDWRVSSFSDGTTTPFNTSSDGSPTNYDGEASGLTKTAGAKWTSATSINVAADGTITRDNASRFAYQAITITAGEPYILELEYSIKDDVATDPEGGRKIIAEMLGGTFTDGADAFAASQGNATQLLGRAEGTVVDGKGVFNKLYVEFVAPASGEASIWISASTPVDAYVDNVKVYPVN